MWPRCADVGGMPHHGSSAATSSSGEGFALIYARWLDVVALFVVIAAFGWWSQSVSASDGLLAVGLAIATYIAARFEVEIVPGVLLTGEFVPIVTAAFVAPALAPILGLVVALLSYPSRRSRLLNTSAIVTSGAAASCLAIAVTSAGIPPLLGPMIVLPILTLICGVLVGLFVVPMGYVKGGLLLQTVASGAGASCIILAPLLAGILYAHERFGDPALIVILLPLAIAQYFLNMYKRKVELTEELLQSNQTLAKTNLQLAMAMVRALDARDAYTAGHSAAVAVYTRDIALEAGHGSDTARKAHLAGLLHDIGKIGVPGSVLNKRERLTDEEFELMKEHARIGADILGEVDSYSEISIIVRHHHERIDGRGYPDGIAGEMIPAISRMIGVADTYSAMTTDRPYRKGLDPEIAIGEIAKNRGTQLDELYVDAFLRILERSDDAYRRGKQADFEVEIAKHQALGDFEAKVLEEAADHTAADDDLLPVVPLPAREDEQPAAVSSTDSTNENGEPARIRTIGQTTKPIGMEEPAVDPDELDKDAA